MVEIIVVVGIIGVLTSAAVLVFSNQQKRSRDARRIADVGSISDAIQQYVSLGNDVPTTGGNWSRTSGPELAVLVSSGLMNKVPDEFKSGGSTTRCSVYHYDAPNNNTRYATDPAGAQVGLREYSLSFHSEVTTSAGYHPMNSALFTISTHTPEASCPYYSAFLFGPRKL